MIVEYNEMLMQWLFVLGMEVMRLNFVYQVFVGNFVVIMFYNGYEVFLSFEFVSDGFGNNFLVFIFVDFLIWSVDFLVYFVSMVIIFILQFGGEVSLDEGD